MFHSNRDLIWPRSNGVVILNHYDLQRQHHPAADIRIAVKLFSFFFSCYRFLIPLPNLDYLSSSGCFRAHKQKGRTGPRGTRTFHSSSAFNSPFTASHLHRLTCGKRARTHTHANGHGEKKKKCLDLWGARSLARPAAAEFLENVSMDTFAENVYIFSPRRAHLTLPLPHLFPFPPSGHPQSPCA